MAMVAVMGLIGIESRCRTACQAYPRQQQQKTNKTTPERG
jgi:hypothetical protein